MPNISVAQSAVTLKMQSAWGPADADPFFTMNKQYAQKVEALSGGTLKIEVLAVNAVLKTAEIADGVSTGVVDAGHTVTAYWYGKNPASSLFGTGPSYGFSSQELMGWIEYGINSYNPELLVHEQERELIGFLAQYPRIVASAAQMRQPHRVARFIEDLAAQYHRFYNDCRVLPLGEEKPTQLNSARATLSLAAAQVISNGLELLGVSAPERM